VVGAPAVERSEAEHELLQFERLGEVAVGAEFEPGGLVAEPAGGGEHEDRQAAAGGGDAFGDPVTGGPGDVAVEDGDVVAVDAQQSKSGVAVTGDVCRDRGPAQPIAVGLAAVTTAIIGTLVYQSASSSAPMVVRPIAAGLVQRGRTPCQWSCQGRDRLVSGRVPMVVACRVSS